MDTVPQLGVDYDDVFEVHTFEEIDHHQKRIRDEYREATGDESWVVEAFDCGPPVTWDRDLWFIGWRLQRPDGKRIWLRIKLDELTELCRNRTKKENI